MLFLYIFFLYQLFIPLIFTLHLNNNQLTLIRRSIQSGQLSQSQRTVINNILYKSYEKWSCKKALEFKQLHKHKCFNINNNELMFSSKIGLYKSIQKYNGNYDIINYATIYIRSELLRLITDKYSTSILPKSIRRSSKKNHSRQQLNNYKYSLDVTYANTYENWQLERLFISQQEDILEKNMNSDIFDDILNYHTPFIKRIIYLKYFSNSKILSNKHVSELMCSSEETIRQNLKKINIIDG